MRPRHEKTEGYYAKIRQLTRFMKKNPDNINILRARANQRFWHGDWRKATKDYEALAKREPCNLTYWAMMGQTSCWAKLPEKAVEGCTRAIALDPEDEYAFMHRGWAYRQLKQWDSSIADYTKAIEIGLKYRSSMHSTLYRGLLYMEMGEYEKAAQDFSFAIKRSRWWGRLYYFRGKAYLKLKQYDKVIKNANAVMKIVECPVIHYLKQRSIAYKKLGQKEKAQADLALVEELKIEEQKDEEKRKQSSEKEMAEIERKNKIQRDENLKKHNALIDKYTAAIELNDKDAEAYFLRGHALYEQTLYEPCKYKEASTDFSKAIKLNRKMWKAYYYRGKCFYYHMHYSKALRDYSKAILLNPNSVAAYNERINIYRTIGDVENEIADLEKLVMLNAWALFINGSLGSLYEDSGKFDKAADFYTRALSLKKYSVLNNFIDFTAYGGDLSYNQIIQKLDEAISQCPENAVLYVLRGNKYSKINGYPKAIADFSKAIELQPNLIIAYIFRISAYSRLRSDTVSLRIADLLKAIKLDNTLPFLHSELGLLYKLKGNYKLALHFFTKALSIDPERYQDYSDRSEIYEALGEYQAAIDDLNTILVDRHGTSWIEIKTLSRRADLYRKIGEYNKALADFCAVINYKKNESYVDDRRKIWKSKTLLF